jgi:phage gp36-like protein
VGNYASTTELIARFASTEEAAYATDSLDPAVPTTTVLAEAIGSAEGEMNSYIAKRYLVPAVTTDTEVDELLTSCALDMAKFHLLNRKPNTPEQVTRQYERRVEWLQKIATGGVVLPATATLASTTSDDPLADWSDSTRTLDEDRGRMFSRETMSSL